MIKNLYRYLCAAAVALLTFPAGAQAPEGYKLVWSDEFDEGTQLSPAKWSWEDWRPGNVNNERQYYKPGTQLIDGRHTTEIKDGKLVINCFKASDGNVYSGRVNSNSGDGNPNGWNHGYIEARIKLPKGKGTWPAFWMMPSGVDWSSETWPTCGEIDIMEEVGADPNITSSSLHSIGHNHTNGSQVTASRYIDGAEDDFHIYSMEWSNERITTYVDGVVMLDYANDHKGFRNWPYDKPYYVILNLAWGGDWGGYKGVDESALPLKMEVDYVRVYRKSNPKMADDGSGAAYIFGSYRNVGIDGFVPSESYYDWAKNVIPMKSDGKIHKFNFIMGQNLRTDDVNFKFFAVADPNDDYGFTATPGKYHIEVESNPYLYADTEENGNIKLKKDAPVSAGDNLAVTLDCTAGTSAAVVRVAHSERQPVAPTKGMWIMGAICSVGPSDYIPGNWEWTESRAIKMKKDGDVFTHTFVVGETLNPDVVNFKFFGTEKLDDTWGFTGRDGDYMITSESPIFGIGQGQAVNGVDNGNVYLLPGAKLNKGERINVKVDCTKGYDKAVLTTSYGESGVDMITDCEHAPKGAFRLDGTRVADPAVPGIYIIDGKKVIVR